MVAIYARSSFWAAIQREKRMSCRCCPLTGGDESFEVPANYWVIKVRGKNSYMVGKENNNEDSLLAFSSKMKAEIFLSKIGRSSSKYHFLHFYWRGLVRKFKEVYRYVRIDERVSNKSILILPLK